MAKADAALQNTADFKPSFILNLQISGGGDAPIVPTGATMLFLHLVDGDKDLA